MTSVPGKVGWPIVGDTSYNFYKDPIGYIEKYMSTYKSRIFKSRFLTKPTVFIGTNKGVQNVLQDTSGALELGYKSFMHQVYGDNILFLNDSESTEVRQCLCLLFSHENIQNYQKVVDKITSRHIDNIDTSKPFCVYNMLKRVSTEICLSLFLDMDFEQAGNSAEKLLSLTKTHWHGIISVPLPVKLPGMGSASNFSKALEAKAVLLQIIKEKLKLKSEFVDNLESLGFPSDTSIENHLLLFTSALVPKAIASLLTSFITATGQADQVSCQDDLLSDSCSLMESVLLEVQRFYPPFIGGRRLVRKNCVIDGYIVEEGQAIVYLTQSAHRDPSVFPDPDKFDPSRWTNGNATDKDKLFCFGSGARNCVGKNFVMNIVQTILEKFLAEYRWKLVDGQDVTHKWLPISRPRESVMVQLSKRHP